MPFGRRQPAGFCGVDRRRCVRQQANAVAIILLPMLGTIPGRVVDFSNSGAWLKIASPFGLPDTFELRFFGQTHRSRIVRRGSGHIGLQFISVKLHSSRPRPISSCQLNRWAAATRVMWVGK